MRAVIALLALVGCGDEPVPIPPECNGYLELCARRFDEVSYVTTHNAMSNGEDSWVMPNQNFNIGHQLDDGVRGLMLDVHEWGDGILLCHGPCSLGELPLAEGLSIIRRFLRTHRGEVVTIIFESKTTAVNVAQGFVTSELDDYVYPHTPGTPWPTLRELIDHDQRVVVFTDNEGGALNWYMDVWQHAFETHYQASTIDEFSCDMNRGMAGNALFIFNHFLSDPLAVPDQADTVNANPLLIDRARTCMQARAHLPNFVTVDFYDRGAVFDAVRMLNGL